MLLHHSVHPYRPNPRTRTQKLKEGREKNKACHPQTKNYSNIIPTLFHQTSRMPGKTGRNARQTNKTITVNQTSSEPKHPTRTSQPAKPPNKPACPESKKHGTERQPRLVSTTDGSSILLDLRRIREDRTSRFPPASLTPRRVRRKQGRLTRVTNGYGYGKKYRSVQLS